MALQPPKSCNWLRFRPTRRILRRIACIRFNRAAVRPSIFNVLLRCQLIDARMLRIGNACASRQLFAIRKASTQCSRFGSEASKGPAMILPALFTSCMLKSKLGKFDTSNGSSGASKIPSISNPRESARALSKSQHPRRNQHFVVGMSSVTFPNFEVPPHVEKNQKDS